VLASVPFLSPDQIALVAALGAMAGGAAAPWRIAVAAGAIVIGACAALYGIGLPWWSGPGAALVLGILVYAGVPLGGYAALAVAGAGGLIAGLNAGLIAGSGLSASSVVATGAALAGLALVAGLSRWTTRRGGAWACQTARLVGGLAAFAGAAILFIGGPA